MNGLENCVKRISYSVLAIEKNCNKYSHICKQNKKSRLHSVNTLSCISFDDAIIKTELGRGEPPVSDG